MASPSKRGLPYRENREKRCRRYGGFLFNPTRGRRDEFHVGQDEKRSRTGGEGEAEHGGPDGTGKRDAPVLGDENLGDGLP